MIDEKINNFLNAPYESINLGNVKNLKLNDLIKVYWGDEPIGKIEKGINILSPKVVALNSEYLDSNKKILVSKKLQLWLDKIILSTLKPIKEEIDQTISSVVRAIIFNVFESLGTILIDNYYNTIKNLDEHDKVVISRLGIRIGAKFFFMPNLLKKFPMELSAILWQVFNNVDLNINFPLPTDGRVSFESKINMPDTYWLAIGYIYLDGFAVRADIFERIFFLARQKIKYGPFVESSDLMNPIGCNSDQLKKILNFCNFESSTMGDDKKIFFSKVKNKKNNNKIKENKMIIKIQMNKKKKSISLIKKVKPKIKKVRPEIKNVRPETKKNNPDPNSPFAVLEKLL